MKTILTAYLACALWSSNGDDGEPLDKIYGIVDFAPAAVVQAEKELADFLAYCDEVGLNPFAELDAEQVGHDFWLTRNHHGTGFWDRRIETGRSLSDAAHTFGESDAYVGDDGKIYLT